METGPAGQDAAGSLRASDADRERVVALLQAAFAQGRLSRDEFGERVGGALTARTYADLTTLTADIPAAAPRCAARPARSRPRPGRRTVTGGCTLVTGVLMLADTAVTGSGATPLANLFYVLFIMGFVAAFISWLCAIAAQRGDATAGRLPPGPAPGGRDEAAVQEADAALRGAHAGYCMTKAISAPR